MIVSYLFLFVSTTLCLLGFIMVCITFGSDHWYEYKVERENLIRLTQADLGLRDALGSLNDNEVYFDRSFGLFRVCFPDEVPSSLASKNDRSSCFTTSWAIPEDVAGFARIDIQTEAQKARTHLIRACVASYSIGIALLSVGFILVLCYGCVQWWTLVRRPKLIMASGLTVMAATLFLIVAMVFWLRAKYLEDNVIAVAPYPRTWHPMLKRNVSLDYGWSYVLFWLGFTLLVISWIGLIIGYYVLKKDLRKQAERARKTSFEEPRPLVSYQYPTNTYAAYPPYYGQGVYGYNYNTYTKGRTSSVYY